MANWVFTNEPGDFEKIGETLQISPNLVKVIRNRGVEGEEAVRKYLSGTVADLYDPHTMKNMDQAAEVLRQKISEGKKIRIIGDYDIDGVCSTYILLTGFKAIGADVDYAIPHRVKDGYGINDDLILQAHEDGREVIVTCDNGIAASAQVDYAKKLGMSVVITDHHEIPYEEIDGERVYHLPDADAVVDPKQPGDTYPNAGICGAVVAYKLIQVLCPDEEEMLDNLIEIAAIATVGDVMELLDENRIIVKEGLKRLNHTKNIGLKALISACDLLDKKINSYHIGFVLGPCINATGRLDIADRALELLLCENQRNAMNLANDLKNLNERRKSMTDESVRKAIEMIEQEGKLEDVLVLHMKECHESLAGIIAGRLREKFYRPTIVLTDSEEGVKGSGRSIPGYNMHDALVEVKDLLDKFGGHSMAAGLSLQPENVIPLREALNRNSRLKESRFEREIKVDAALPFDECTMAFTRQLELLEPFGNGNEKPAFAGRIMRVLSESVVGKNKRIGKYKIQDTKGKKHEMICFDDIDAFRRVYQSAAETGIDVVYESSINEFRGERNVQFILKDYMPVKD